MHKQNSFLLIILTFFAFLLILLLKIDDFEKKSCPNCNEIVDFTGFSKLTGSKLNMQK